MKVLTKETQALEAMMPKVKGQRVAIKGGWEDAGKQGVSLGEPVYIRQWWTPVLWDGEEDPTFHKTAGLLKEAKSWVSASNDLHESETDQR